MAERTFWKLKPLKARKAGSRPFERRKMPCDANARRGRLPRERKAWKGHRV